MQEGGELVFVRVLELSTSTHVLSIIYKFDSILILMCSNWLQILLFHLLVRLTRSTLTADTDGGLSRVLEASRQRPAHPDQGCINHLGLHIYSLSQAQAQTMYLSSLPFAQPINPVTVVSNDIT